MEFSAQLLHTVADFTHDHPATLYVAAGLTLAQLLWLAVWVQLSNGHSSHMRVWILRQLSFSFLDRYLRCLTRWRVQAKELLFYSSYCHSYGLRRSASIQSELSNDRMEMI